MSLRIIAARTANDKATDEFIARSKVGNKSQALHEISRFLRLAGNGSTSMVSSSSRLRGVFRWLLWSRNSCKIAEKPAHVAYCEQCHEVNFVDIELADTLWRVDTLLADEPVDR